MLGLAAGAVAFGVAMVFAPWQVAVLVAWDAAALVVVGWVLPVILRCDGDATQALATREDDSRSAADLVLVVAGLVSLGGVALGLVKGSQAGGLPEAGITALAVATVVLSWAAVQTVFTLRYAHLYYGNGAGGIDFNSEERPDYRDFAYLAVTIGMTYQVSDTNLTSKVMRRPAPRHGLLSFVFGTFVVAVTINVVAGLIG